MRVAGINAKILVLEGDSSLVEMNKSLTEVANKDRLHCVWGPFTIRDLALLVDIQPKLLISLGELVVAALVFQ